ncbi:DUF6602 domain-containing protein [Neobacillus sp. NPDC093127]|uniref:DUF6602 domain-containing protein n=1 Tax=Neobacillus sp. NPDC093127 TaxID=3364296 RepID=UPI0038071F24
MSSIPYIEKILSWNIDLLKTHYEKSRDLYEKMENRKLISIDEYGRYREEACREFIAMLVPGRFAIGEGFIVNATEGDRSISTQTDIVVYDKSTSPFTNSHIRFYPVESIAAIGEVKSTLKPEELTEALCKLADQKAIRTLGYTPGDSLPIYRDKHLIENQSYFIKKIQETIYRKVDRKYGLEEEGILQEIATANKILEAQGLTKLSESEEEYLRKLIEYGFESEAELNEAFDSVLNNISLMRDTYYNPEKHHFDHVMSFLVCKNIDMSKKDEGYNFSNLLIDINKAYEEKGTLPFNRHNLILSIDDGVFLYFDNERKHEHIAYPLMPRREIKQRFIPVQDKDKEYHFKQFAHHLFIGVQNATILHPETSYYLNWNVEQTAQLNLVDEQ